MPEEEGAAPKQKAGEAYPSSMSQPNGTVGTEGARKQSRPQCALKSLPLNGTAHLSGILQAPHLHGVEQILQLSPCDVLLFELAQRVIKGRIPQGRGVPARPHL